MANKKEYLTTTQVAKSLGISRMHVLRKIKKNEIKAERIGRNFVVSKEELNPIYKPLNEKDKKRIDEGVKKVIRSYGEVLKKLGQE